MLNLVAFTLLADRKKIPDGTLRLIVQLVRDYDLSQFRVLPLATMKHRYRLTFSESGQHLKRLLLWGLLVEGPRVRVYNAPSNEPSSPTYRLGSQYLLTGPEIRALAAEHRAREDRMQVAPTELVQGIQ